MSTLAMRQPAHLLAATGGSHLTLAGGAAGALILAVVAGIFFFMVGALVSVLRSQHSGGMKLVWTVIILAAPALGSIGWFVIGRRDAQRHRAFG
ncbi:MAG: PLDc_N domain-containing protein [Nocardiopsaceae bacterium]|nr:PLDc_N domain-containing protein [Nocardiopsaceae bacterium]